MENGLIPHRDKNAQDEPETFWIPEFKKGLCQKNLRTNLKKLQMTTDGTIWASVN